MCWGEHDKDGAREMTAAQPFKPLTLAQEKVCRFVARGGTYKQIAAKLGMSPRAVKAHVEHVADLLPEDGVDAKARVTIWAVLAGY